MSSIDQLLSGALMIKGPHVPADVASADASYGRGRYSCACQSDGYAYGYACPPAASTPPAGAEADTVVDNAATGLQVLCETVVNHTATTSLTDLVTESLPAPRGARLVGCILQLTDAQDSARLWWQYAAGAGDNPAGYLLYLYHLSRGEDRVADWWLDQIGIDSTAQDDAVLVDEGIRNADTLAVETDIATILRILTRLVDPEAPSRRTELVCTVMDYVASAVATGSATHPEAQIPLPTGFAEHLDLVLASTESARAASKRAGQSRVLVGEWFNPRAE